MAETRSTIAELSRQLVAGEVSSRELAQNCLDRIESDNKALNSFISVVPDLALAAADAADKT
ncbi:MAG: Asp-tRNA(Asn)/Glu-tRNA(Gln) amidotransferase subunit GatA, partial [Gammaproteobacteria bacterium]